MTTLYKTPLTTLAAAKGFIQAMVTAGSVFHFEDDPHDIESFTSEEADDLTQRVAELYSFSWGTRFKCPIGYALHCMRSSWDN